MRFSGALFLVALAVCFLAFVAWGISGLIGFALAFFILTR